MMFAEMSIVFKNELNCLVKVKPTDVAEEDPTSYLSLNVVPYLPWRYE
jgi:hypothetical protein